MKNTQCDKRLAILEAALELIAEYGFHGAPMAMVADRAGVGAGTIYRYFDNKDLLIAELYRDLEQKLKVERYDVLRTKEEFTEVLQLGDAKAIKDSSNAWHSAKRSG